MEGRAKSPVKKVFVFFFNSTAPPSEYVTELPSPQFWGLYNDFLQGVWERRRDRAFRVDSDKVYSAGGQVISYAYSRHPGYILMEVALYLFAFFSKPWNPALIIKTPGKSRLQSIL
jgi:hypothetical protein